MLILAGATALIAWVSEILAGSVEQAAEAFGMTEGTRKRLAYNPDKDLVRNVDWTNFGKKRVSQASLGVLVDSFDPKSVIARMNNKEIDAWTARRPGTLAIAFDIAGTAAELGRMTEGPARKGIIADAPAVK